MRRRNSSLGLKNASVRNPRLKIPMMLRARGDCRRRICSLVALLDRARAGGKLGARQAAPGELRAARRLPALGNPQRAHLVSKLGRIAAWPGESVSRSAICLVLERFETLSIRRTRNWFPDGGYPRATNGRRLASRGAAQCPMSTCHESPLPCLPTVTPCSSLDPALPALRYHDMGAS